MVAALVILTFIAFVVVDFLLRRSKVKARRRWGETDRLRRGETPSLSDLVPSVAFRLVSLPAGLFLDRGHTWVEVDPYGRAQVGLDDFVQRAIGRIDWIELPRIGQAVRCGEPLFTIHQGERMAVFTAPIAGVVSSVNESLARHPEAIESDPYDEGWICRLKPKDLAKSLRRLFVAEEAMQWLKSEIQRFQEFIAARPIETMALGRVLQDGGELTGGVLELMDDETWRRFADKFLMSDE